MQRLGTVTLQTERLTLRRLTVEDAPAMFANWASDPEVTRYLTWAPHQDADETRAVLGQWVSQYDDPTFYQWAIVLRELGEPVGTISVVGYEGRAEVPEIGYCIGRAWWHQGITSEALSAVLDFLFAEVGAHRVMARHAVDNPNSGGVMRHCGMRLEGTQRAADRCNAGITDICLYGILDEDWRAARHARELMRAEAVTHPAGTKTPADSHTVTTHLLRHEDINGANRLFGGRLMEWIDDAAGIAAKRHTGAEITTACVDTLEFRAPAFLDDVVVIDARVTYVGKSSLEVCVDSFMEDVATGTRTLINKAYLTEVCVDEEGRPRVIPYGLALSTAEEFGAWEAALFRKEVHRARRDSGI